MDEMKLKLSSEFMRNLVAKILSKMIYKKTGYKVDVQLNELNVSVIDGETSISTSVQARVNSSEFMKIVKNISSEV